jgi:hypothetical protein
MRDTLKNVNDLADAIGTRNGMQTASARCKAEVEALLRLRRAIDSALEREDVQRLIITEVG